MGFNVIAYPCYCVSYFDICGLSIFALGVYVTMKGSLLNVVKPSAFPEKGIEPDGIKEFL